MNERENGLRSSGIPLGGIGTGTVEFRADGRFYQWQMMNCQPWGAAAPCPMPDDGAFFVVAVHPAEGDAPPRIGALYTPGNFDPMTNNPYALPFLEFPDINASVRFPYTNLHCDFSDHFPVTVELSAWSPFVPFSVADSAWPAGFFRFRIKNTTRARQKITVATAFRNPVGYLSPQNLSRMRFVPQPDGGVVRLSRADLEPESSDNGTMAWGFNASTRGARTSYAFHFAAHREFWEPLYEQGELENRDFDAESLAVGDEGAVVVESGATGFARGALAISVPLDPGAETEIHAVLTWHFPNFYEHPYAPRQVPGARIGHAYAGRFNDADSTAANAFERFNELEQLTSSFSNVFYSTDLESRILDAVSAQLTTLRKSSWLAADGAFGIWEGLGCCGLQTVDVAFQGAFPLILFFPELEKSAMRLTVRNICDAGKIPHMMPGNFHCCDVDRKNRIDLIPQFVLLVWRDYRWSGDEEYRREMIPLIRQMLDSYRACDRNHDGLPDNQGPDQTYDQLALKGASAFVGFLYAAALKAAAELTGEVIYTIEAESALKKLDELLWSDDHYRLSFDVADGKANSGVMVDQLAGNWFYRQCCGQSLIPADRARRAALHVYTHCRRANGYLANCAWPQGDRITVPRTTSNQADWPWSGTEYAFAANLALAGLYDEAKQLCSMVYDRYEKAGLRFNHIECGEHYFRAMSSFALYLALTGQTLNRAGETLEIELSRPCRRYMWCDGAAWGSIDRGGVNLKFMVHCGTPAIKKLVLRENGEFRLAHEFAAVPKPGERITILLNRA